MELLDHAGGSYRFLPGIAPYSGGVVATPGHEIVWVSFRRPRPLREGIRRAAELAAQDGLGAGSVCAFALRSPAPMRLDEFGELNQLYRELLDEFGVLHEDPNPIARTNVVPRPRPPAQPVVHGFAHTRRGGSGDPSFVVAGSAEIRTRPLDLDAVVRPGETSPDALVEKADQVVANLAARLESLGVGWDRVTVLDLYTRHDVPAWLADRILRPVADGATAPLRWFPSDPPVVGLEVELDARGVDVELVAD